ncbi:MAG: DUF5678 domain-containing protein [Endomicrobiia bacterium]|nr:DUF5678 domain-containing protein [Endomicrobiia bacterium]
MKKTLVTNDKYEGKYIALKNLDDNTIVGSGVNPQDALVDAQKQGLITLFFSTSRPKIWSRYTDAR